MLSEVHQITLGGLMGVPVLVFLDAERCMC